MPTRKWNRKSIHSNNPQNPSDPAATKPEKPSFLQRLLKINEYILGIGIFCYLLGFIIENIYLGSFGVANFDVLKARYILVGGMFSVFIVAVGIPVYDFILHYYWEDKGAYSKILFRLIRNAFFLFGTLYFAGSIFTILAGPYNQIPVGVPILNPPEPLVKWLLFALPKLAENSLRFTISLGLIFLGIVVLISLVILIFNPGNKEGKKKSRFERIKEFSRSINPKNVKKGVWLFLLTFMLIFILESASSLMTFMVSNRLSTDVMKSSFTLSPVFARLMVATCAAYLSISCIFLSIALRPVINYDNEKENNRSKPLDRFSAWVYVLGLLITILIPIYSFGVYPSIPQQIGGGLVIPVSITSGNPTIQAQIEKPSCSQFLLDRTANSILALCIDGQTKKYRVIEITSDQIDLIEYRGSP